MSASPCSSISLVRNLAPPATNTAAAAGLLKVLVAAHATGTAVELADATADSRAGSKQPYWVVLGGTQTTLYDANAVVRYLYRTAELALDRRLAIEQLLEWEEMTLNALHGSADLEALLTAADVKADALSIDDAVGAVDVVLLGALHFAFVNAKPETLSRHPSLQAWFMRLGATTAVAAALTTYDANVTKVRVREEPSLENRHVNPAAEYVRNPSETVLPVPGEKNILITSALPYVNNVPHLGNIIGSTLSADAFARFSRLRGNNTLYICGTDEYGTATETKALEEGVSCQELCDKYAALHKEIYEWFGLSFDYFGRTTTEKQTQIVQSIFKSVDQNGFVLEQPTTQLFCEQCQRYLADRFVEGICPHCAYDDARGDQCDKCGKLLNAVDLVEPRCKLDGNRPVVRDSKHLFLDLEQLQPQCAEFVERSSRAGVWSANSTAITRSWLREGLRPRAITRDLKWGVPVPREGYEKKVFYVWFDACIGYPSITANYTDEWERWWKNPRDVQLFQFMGKDNVPFHTVVFPCTQLATGEDWTLLHHISACEYLNYESGKFSKSRGVGVFGNNARHTGVPADIWRYYLLSSRPESSDTVFTWQGFASCNNAVLLETVGNFCNRVLKFLDDPKRYGGVLPAADPALVAPGADTEDRLLIDDVNALLARYIEQMDGVHIRAAIGTARDIAARGNQYLQRSRLDNALFSGSRAQCDTVLAVAANLIYLLSAVFSPFMPDTAAGICCQLNAPARMIPDAFELDLNPGHVLGRPSHLFSRIDDSKVDEWRAQFGGRQSEGPEAATTGV